MTNCTRTALIAIMLSAGSGGFALAQEGIENSWIGANGQWTDSANWDQGGHPDAPSFGDYANISNGGTANVNSAVSEKPGQVILGHGPTETGTLIIGNGGVLTTIDQNVDLP